MMLEHLGEKDHAARIEKALNETFLRKEQCTGDLGGQASTQEFTQFIIEKL
jgi:isocitrate dehydrogenase (NAD+)